MTTLVEAFSQFAHLVVKDLDYKDLSNLLVSCKSLHTRSGYLISEWSFSQQDETIRNVALKRYKTGNLTTSFLQELPLYFRCSSLLSLLSSYVISQSTDLKHTKKEILRSIQRRKLLDVFPLIPSCRLLPADQIHTYISYEDGNIVTLAGKKATPLFVMYELFLEGYCAFFDEWSNSHFFGNHLLQCMKNETVEWLLDQSARNGIVNSLQKEIIVLNISQIRI